MVYLNNFFSSLQAMLSFGTISFPVVLCFFNSFLRYLEGLESTFRSQFKDDISKAALQAAWTTGVIKLSLATNKKGENFYNKTSVEDGNLNVFVYSFSNSGDTGRDLMNQLKDASGLSVKNAQNIKVKRRNFESFPFFSAFINIR